jgi:hypothetical protein
MGLSEKEFSHIFDTAARMWQLVQDDDMRDGVIHLAAELLLVDTEPQYAHILLRYAFRGATGAH